MTLSPFLRSKPRPLTFIVPVSYRRACAVGRSSTAAAAWVILRRVSSRGARAVPEMAVRMWSARSESGTNRGRLFGLVLPVGVGEARVPASVVVGEGVVEDPGADLE